MNPEQQKTVADLRRLIANMRQTGDALSSDAHIRAKLITEGWPVGAVQSAMEASE